MDLGLLPALATYVSSRLADPSTETSERARIENLLMEERAPASGISLYAGYISGAPVQDLDDWNNRHNDYAVAEIEIDPADPILPWTFRPENVPNRLPLVDRRINLIRVENARWPCNLTGVTFEVVSAHIAALSGADPAKSAAAKNFLDRFTATWNAERDKRPLFATTEMEVDDILKDPLPSFAERVRDCLGLGHYSPAAGAAPVQVFVMLYPLEEVYATHGKNGSPAVPTVLDGRLNDFFFPSPVPGPNADPNPCLGHCLNLTLVTAENDYKLGVELLHARIDYRPQHFFRSGIIVNPVTMPFDRARRFHLPWLRLYRDRDDFAADFVKKMS